MFSGNTGTHVGGYQCIPDTDNWDYRAHLDYYT